MEKDNLSSKISDKISQTPEEFLEEQKQKIKSREEFYGIKLIWYNELKNSKIEEQEWIVDKLIPTKSIGVWTGKRGSLKTFLGLNCAFSIASGTPFLGKYSTKQGAVIYLDKENGYPIMKKRSSMITKGMGLNNENLPVAFICFSSLKIDKQSDLEKIEEMIKIHKPILLIVDTYRRGIRFDENDAGKVSKLFVDDLRPIVERNDVSIVLIHHDRKGQGHGDEMDEIRGSSDLANYSDFILKNERERTDSKNIILKQLKNRNAAEENPIRISFNTDEDTINFQCEGDYIKQTKDEKCSEQILIWITEKNIETFKTEQAQKISDAFGISRSNLYVGLNNLAERGLIQSLGKGEYKVLEQRKLPDKTKSKSPNPYGSRLLDDQSSNNPRSPKILVGQQKEKSQ